MALVNPNIAMSFRQPEFRPRNALAEYAQIQQIMGGQRQAEVADMQLQRMRQEDAEIERIHQIAMRQGGPDNRLEMGRALFASRNPTQRELGYKILQHEEAKAGFANAEQLFGYAPAKATAAPAASMAAPAAAAALAPAPEGELVAAPIRPIPLPVTAPAFADAPAPAGETDRAYLQRQFGMPGGAAAPNALAPAAAPSTNAMVAPAAAAPAAPATGTLTGLGGKTLAQLQNEFRTYSRLDQQGAQGAKGRLEEIKREIEFIYKTNEPGAEQKLMRALNIPFTEAGFAKLERLKQNPGEFTRLLEASELPQSARTALIRQRLQKEATHAPATTVNVSTEKKYGEAFGTKMADVDINKMTTAEKAPQLAASANRIIDLVQQGNLFTGPAADIKLNIARALNVAGASNQERISNTEALIAATGQSTLDAIKGAGLGTGQGFTDKDLKFLQGIAGGTIGLTQQTLTELARLQHQTATRSADAWNKRVREMPREVVQGTGLSTTPVVVPPLASAAKKAAPAAPAPPAPPGVDAAIWNVMTPQERALWPK